MRPAHQTIGFRQRTAFLILLILNWIFTTAGCGGSHPAEKSEPHTKITGSPRQLTVAAAADLKFVLGEIITAFHTVQPELQIHATYGSSGNFYSQIVNRAPFDLYLSADVSYPEKLIEQKRADPKTLFRYAIGQIVVWVPKSSPLDVETKEIEIFKDPSIQKIAIANPKHAPYGRAAEAALKNLGVYDQIADRLVLGENIAQAAQFVESGAADIGVIAFSLAMAPALREKGKYWLVPESAYPRLEQAGIILDGALERTGAEEFRSFLLSEESRTIFRSHGFQLPAKE